MRTLLVEDDFICRRILRRTLSSFGDCEIAVNGREALEAFTLAWKERTPYDLICLDIRMPVLDGREALAAIRRMEAEMGLGGLSGVKVIMTTALDDPSHILSAFRTGCEAYLVKPVDRHKLLGHLRSFGLAAECPAKE